MSQILNKIVADSLINYYHNATFFFGLSTMLNNIKEVKDYIQAIDFSKNIDKLIRFDGWLREDVEKTCDQYRKFLLLNKIYINQYGALPPSEDIDEFWHNHILDTQAYIKDCEMIFGCYFHHYPYFGIDDKTNMNDLNRAFETTKKLYQKEFGEEIIATRSQYPTAIYYLLTKAEQWKNKKSKK